MPKFGTKAKDVVAGGFDSDDIWIKTFKVGETRVRFLEATDDWTSYKEHYDPNSRISFPCTEDKSTCIGCNSSVERVRQAPRKYAFNALNDRGQLSVFKLGSKLYRTFQSREQRIGTVQDRDYTIIRSGTTMEDTVYDIDPGERYTVDFKDEIHDIGEILASKYLEAVESYGGDEDDVVAEPVAKTATKSVSKPKEEPAVEEDTDCSDWPLSKLRAYLTEHNQEFPSRATRDVLIPLVEKNISEGGPTF